MDLLDSILKLQEKYDDPDIVVKASDIKRPQSALDREMFEDANRRFNQADGGRIGFDDGGMLVQPSADGSRPGYREPIIQRKVRQYLKNLPKNSEVVILDIAKELKIDRGTIDKVLNEKEIKNKNFKIMRRAGFITNEDFIKEFKKYQKSDEFITGTDKEFAKYLNDKGFKAENKSGEHNERSIKTRRQRLGIESVSVTAPRYSDKEILKQAKKFKINTKDLSPKEIRDKVANKRQQKSFAEKRAEDPELDERIRKRMIKAANKRYDRLKSTEEGKTKLRDIARKARAIKYQKEGLDPPANSAKEMLWKDSVKIAKGDGRFNIVSGYKKSMKKGDYYSNKIKIKDSVTGKTFTFNTLENFINKNAGSFNVKNFEEVIRPYKQKQYINDKGFRNILNEVLIPGWSAGDRRTAFTIQHDFGRNINPFKVSLAFYDDNIKEYKIRSDFEKAWQTSKTSKTPLKDRKLAFNVFKKDLGALNIRSSPSMVTRDRAFGKELDLKSIFKKAKKQGAILPRGALKEASEFDKQILNNIQSYSKLSKCKVNLKADGGRIGFANSIECIQDGLKEQKIAAQQGNKKAARELVQVGKVATRAGLLKNLLGPGALLGEAVIEGAIIGNKVLGGTPADIAYAESYLSYLDPRKYRGELDPLKMAREDMLTREVEDAEGNIKTIAAPGSSILKSGFAAQDQLSAFNKAVEDRDLAKARGRIDQYIPAAAEAREQGARAGQSADIVSSEAFKDASRVAQEYLQGQTGTNIAKYRTDDFGRFESGRERDLRRRRMQEMSNIMPRDFLTEKTSDLLDRTQYLRSLGFDVSTKDLMAEQERLKSIPLSQDAITYSPEQVYGTQGEFAGGGIAKLAGVSSGPPPESGPNSQGLQGLMKRVRNL
jgi:hypothetical protein